MSHAEEPKPYYKTYTRLAPPDDDLSPFLKTQHNELISLLRSVSESDSLVCHPPYTWTLKQVVNHLSDCERVFSFRLLWFARGETSELSSFDENLFSNQAFANESRWETLIEEFDAIRRSTICLIDQLPVDAKKRVVLAAGFKLDIHTQCQIIYGHVAHHHRIIQERLTTSANMS